MGDEEMLRSVYGDLRRFAAVVGPREIGPDDLLHEAIVRTLRSGPLDRLDHPVAYLRRAIVNEAANARRSLGRARRARLRLAGGERGSAADVYPTDLAHFDELEPTWRAVLFLHELEGFSYAEIGEQLDLSEANARQIASRARSKVRQHIEDAS